jgi:hypothetical protein
VRAADNCSSLRVAFPLNRVAIAVIIVVIIVVVIIIVVVVVVFNAKPTPICAQSELRRGNDTNKAPDSAASSATGTDGTSCRGESSKALDA